MHLEPDSPLAHDRLVESGSPDEFDRVEYSDGCADPEKFCREVHTQIAAPQGVSKRQPLPGAKLKVKFWYDEATILTTGPDGKASRSDRIHADPTGQSIDVTIKGSDGTERTTTATMP